MAILAIITMFQLCTYHSEGNNKNNDATPSSVSSVSLFGCFVSKRYLSIWLCAM